MSMLQVGPEKPGSASDRPEPPALGGGVKGLNSDLSGVEPPLLASYHLCADGGGRTDAGRQLLPFVDDMAWQKTELTLLAWDNQAQTSGVTFLAGGDCEKVCALEQYTR